MTPFLIALYLAIGIYAGVRFARYMIEGARKTNDVYAAAGFAALVAVIFWPASLIWFALVGIGRLVGKGA